MHQILRGSLDQGLKPVPFAFKGFRGFRLPARKCINCSVAASTKDSRTQATAVCFWGPPRLPQMYQMLRGSSDHGLKPVPFGFKGLRGCRLPGRKCIKCSVAASTKDSSQCPLVLRASESAVCQPANASNAPWQLGPRTQASALCF